MHKIPILIISMIVLYSGYRDESPVFTTNVDFDFKSKWQSLNDRNCLIEFTDSSYHVYRDQEIFISFNYEINHIEEEWYELRFFMKTSDKSDEAMHASIQVVSRNRIRILFWKHHHILDVADEYYRTDSLDDFDMIMKEIFKED